ncbi:hypothetical protein ACUWFG_12875, partial [Escherichia coli]
IGLAGSTYDNNYPEDQAVKNFVVANITGSDCRQLIHVENGKHFVIRNIKARNITPDFSKKAGIDNATVAIYGCDNFVVRGVFMAKRETLLSLANIHAVNETGQSSVDIDRINHHIVNVEKINFRLPERRE